MFFTRILMGVALATSFHVFGQDARPVSVTKITGADEINDVDTELGFDGKTRLLTRGVPSQGVDPHATTWFYIGTQFDADGVGGLNDTVRVEIPAAVTPLNTIYPAVDVTTTVTNAILIDDNPERALALEICDELDSDVNFSTAQWSCQVIKDYSAVFISSTIFNEFGRRTVWTLTSTGSTVVEQVQPDIVNRTLFAELSRSPNDPRKGTLAISGTIEAIVSGVGNIFVEFLRIDGTGSKNMRVDGAPTNIHFDIPCSATHDTYVQSVRIFGGCNGIRFDQFLCMSTLSSGLKFTVLSHQQELQLDNIKDTEDFKNLFSIGEVGAGTLFRVDIQAGSDQFIAEYAFRTPVVIQKCGSNPAGDDYIRWRVRDDLSSGLDALESMAIGFLREPT